MNKEYITINDEFVVTNEVGEMKTFPNDEDLLKVLQLENDIDNLFNQLDAYKDDIDYTKHEMLSSLIESGIYFLGSLLILIFANSSFYLIGITPLIMVGITRLFSYFKDKKEYKTILSKCKYINKMIDLVSKEKDDLKEKIKEQENKNSTLEIKKVNNGPSIEEMKRYLELIDLYNEKRSKLVSLYKKDGLGVYMSYAGHDADDINFVGQLIEDDLGKNKEKGKSLVKKK